MDAGGNEIKRKGKATVRTDSGTMKRGVFKVGQCRETLISVDRLQKTGHDVILTKNKPRIVNLRTGEVMGGPMESMSSGGHGQRSRGTMPEALAFLRHLAKAKARNEPPLMQRRAQQAWKMRWLAIMSCTAARAVSSSLLELRGHGSADGVVPMTHEVEADFRHARLG